MPETAQTLDRGLQILELLADEPHGRTVAELATELELGRAIVYRLVTTLERHRLLRRTPEGRLRLGFGLLELAGDVQPQLRDAVQRPLRALAEDVGATAHLAVAEGGEAVALVVVEPSRTDFHVAYRVGARHPLGQGAAGRAILLGRDPVGTLPYVMTSGELQSGAYGIAAPILGVAGLDASVGVVAMHALPDGTGAAVVATAATLSTRLA